MLKRYLGDNFTDDDLQAHEAFVAKLQEYSGVQGDGELLKQGEILHFETQGRMKPHTAIGLQLVEKIPPEHIISKESFNTSVRQGRASNIYHHDRRKPPSSQTACGG